MIPYNHYSLQNLQSTEEAISTERVNNKLTNDFLKSSGNKSIFGNNISLTKKQKILVGEKGGEEWGRSHTSAVQRKVVTHKVKG